MPAQVATGREGRWPDTDSFGQRGTVRGPTIGNHVPHCDSSRPPRRRARGPRIPRGYREDHPGCDHHFSRPRGVDRILGGSPVPRAQLDRRPSAGGSALLAVRVWKPGEHGEVRSSTLPTGLPASRRRASDRSWTTVNRFADPARSSEGAGSLARRGTASDPGGTGQRTGTGKGSPPGGRWLRRRGRGWRWRCGIRIPFHRPEPGRHSTRSSPSPGRGRHENPLCKIVPVQIPGDPILRT
jgi:hypothetical protein